MEKAGAAGPANGSALALVFGAGAPSTVVEAAPRLLRAIDAHVDDELQEFAFSALPIRSATGPGMEGVDDFFGLWSCFGFVAASTSALASLRSEGCVSSYLSSFRAFGSDASLFP
jgi:hypothetical protein